MKSLKLKVASERKNERIFGRMETGTESSIEMIVVIVVRKGDFYEEVQIFAFQVIHILRTRLE